MHLSKFSALVLWAVAAAMYSGAHAAIVMEDKPSPQKGGSAVTQAGDKNSMGPVGGPMERQSKATLVDPNDKKAKGVLIDPNNKTPKDPALDINLKK